MPSIKIEKAHKQRNLITENISLMQSIEIEQRKNDESYFRKRYNRSYVPFISERNQFG